MRVLSHRGSKRGSGPRATAPEVPHEATLTDAGTPGPAPAPAPADPDALLITRPHAGLYLVTDGEGHVVGRINGDYVVGFTAEYRGQTQVFADIDDAKSTIAELHALEGRPGSPS